MKTTQEMLQDQASEIANRYAAQLPLLKPLSTTPKFESRIVFEEIDMDNQCNTCGSHDHLVKCTHCPTIICEHCKMAHEPYCEAIQKRKRRGEGPTVMNILPPAHRAGHETPSGVPAPPPAPKEPIGRVSRPPLTAVLHQDNMPELSYEPIAPTPDSVEESQSTDVDAQLNAIKDLQDEN